MEKDIKENELKLQVPETISFNKIYSFLKEKYIMYPYDKSVVYDTYYDTDKLWLYNSGCCFRVRQKRNTSINFKTKGVRYENIWSRREYRDALRNKKVDYENILSEQNKTTEVVRTYLKSNDLGGISKSCTILSKRTSYLLKSKQVDETGKAEIYGVCTFDTFFDVESPFNEYKEFEIEICNALITPNVFQELINLGRELCLECSLLGSEMSKYETIMRGKE